MRTMNGKAMAAGAAGSMGTGALFGAQFGYALLGLGGALAFLSALAFVIGMNRGLDE